MQTLTKTDFNIQRNLVSFYYTFRYVVYQKNYPAFTKEYNCSYCDRTADKA